MGTGQALLLGVSIWCEPARIEEQPRFAGAEFRSTVPGRSRPVWLFYSCSASFFRSKLRPSRWFSRFESRYPHPRACHWLSGLECLGTDSASGGGVFRRPVLFNLQVLNCLLKRRRSSKALHCQHRVRLFSHVPATGPGLILMPYLVLGCKARNHPVRQAWRRASNLPT